MAEDRNRDEKGIDDWAKRMGVDVDDLKAALKRYNQDVTDLRNVDKRNLLTTAIDQKWTRDQFAGAYDTSIADEADWDWEQIVTKFGYSLGVVKQFQKELKPIFKWLADQLQKGEPIETLTEAFNKKLDKTEFGRRTTTEIAADIERYGPGLDFRDRLRDLSKEIRKTALERFGASAAKALEGAAGREIALDLIYNEAGFLTDRGFDVDMINRRLREFLAEEDKAAAEQPGYDPNAPASLDVEGGFLGSVQNELLQWLSRNGVVMTAERVRKYALGIEAGTTDLEAVKQDVRNKDFSRQYMAYAELFKSGQDVADVAIDFRQAAANLLEKPLESVTMDDPLVKKALQYRTKDGQPAPMALYEFEQEVRNSPDWDKTDNAMQAYTSIGETILRNFGFRG